MEKNARGMVVEAMKVEGMVMHNKAPFEIIRHLSMYINIELEDQYNA